MGEAYFLFAEYGISLCSQTLSLARGTCQLGDDVASYWVSHLSIGPRPMSISTLSIEFQVSRVGVLGG
jgi:hypothetical protein